MLKLKSAIFNKTLEHSLVLLSYARAIVFNTNANGNYRWPNNLLLIVFHTHCRHLCPAPATNLCIVCGKQEQQEQHVVPGEAIKAKRSCLKRRVGLVKSSN